MVFFTHAFTEINKQNKEKSFTDAKQFLALCYSSSKQKIDRQKEMKNEGEQGWYTIAL